jgi:hypothetical protein
VKKNTIDLSENMNTAPSVPVALCTRAWFSASVSTETASRQSKPIEAAFAEFQDGMKPRLRIRTRFPGITEDARKLGVNRATLFKMLRGYPGFANLKTLRARYAALKRKGAA